MHASGLLIPDPSLLLHSLYCTTESCNAGHITLIIRGRSGMTLFVSALMLCFVITVPEGIHKRKT